jgi:putative flippase GtrA
VNAPAETPADSTRADRRPGHGRSFIIYVAAGVASVATHYAFMIAAVEVMAWRELVATSVGFMIGAITKYLMNYFVAFKSEEPHGRAIPRFAVMLLTLFAANAAMFWTLHDQYNLHYIVAQILTTGFLVPVGYLINRWWVFR